MRIEFSVDFTRRRFNPGGWLIHTAWYSSVFKNLFVDYWKTFFRTNSRYYTPLLIICWENQQTEVIMIVKEGRARMKNILLFGINHFDCSVLSPLRPLHFVTICCNLFIPFEISDWYNASKHASIFAVTFSFEQSLFPAKNCFISGNR